MANTSVIPATRVPVVDDNGLMTREWYRFFSGLATLTGSGSNNVTLTDLQLLPPSIPQQQLLSLSLDPP